MKSRLSRVVASVLVAALALFSVVLGPGSHVAAAAQPTVSMSSPAVSVGESAGTASVSVSLSAASGQAVTVPYTVSSVSGDTATATDDYTSVSGGSLTISAGDTGGTITVTIASDLTDEHDETFTVTLGSSPTNAALHATATKTVVTITDDDAAPRITSNRPAVREGASGTTTTMTFKVGLSRASGKTVTMNYSDISGGGGYDYTPVTAGTLTFRPGETSKDINVSVIGDGTAETDEDVLLLLDSLQNVFSPTFRRVLAGKIYDDDNVGRVHSIEIDPDSGTLGVETTPTSAEFTRAEDIDVVVKFRDAISTSFDQIMTVTGRPQLALTIGNVTRYATYSGVVDGAAYNGIRFRYTVQAADKDTDGISIPANAIRLNGGTIRLRDSTYGSVQLNSRAVSSRHTVSGSTHSQARISRLVILSNSSGQYRLITRPSAALDAEPYSEHIIRVIVHFSKRVRLTVGASIALNFGTHGQRGQRRMRAGASSTFVRYIIFSYRVTARDHSPDGFAIGGSLYLDPGATLRDASGADALLHSSVWARKSSKVNAGIGLLWRTLDSNWQDNQVYVKDSRIRPLVLPGAGGHTGTLTYELTGPGVPGVPWVTTTLTLPDGLTYDASTNTLSGTPTETAARQLYKLEATDTRDDGTTPDIPYYFTIEVKDDSTPTFGSGSIPAQEYTQNSSLGTSAVPAVIFPAATGGDGRLTYKLTGPGTTATTLTLPSGITYTPPLSTNTTSGGALTGAPTTSASQATYKLTATDVNGSTATLTFTMVVAEDFMPSFGTATIDDRSWTHRVEISPFTLPAATGGNGTLTYSLSPNLPAGVVRSAGTSRVSGTPTGVMAATTYKWTATDADGDKAELTFSAGVLPVVSLASGTASVGESDGTKDVTVSLSAASARDVTVPYTVSSESTDTAGTDDYTSVSDGSLTISAGDTSGTITVTVASDTADETDETFTVTLGSSPTNAALGTTTKTVVTITDDDDPPTVSMSAATASVGESAGTKDVTVSLSAASGKTVTVPYTVSSESTDTAGTDDYTSVSSGSLQIAAGNSSGTITVTVASDTVDEPDETFTVTLGSSPTNAVLHDTATKTVVTITDDDAAPTVTLSLASSTISENGGTTTVTAALSHASSRDTTITLQAVSGFYTPGSDKTIAISAGQTTNSSDTATINAVDDTIDNVTARTTTVTARADNSQGAGAVTGASLTLTDDEATPTVTLSLSDSSISENGGSATVTASLSGESSEKVTLTVSAAAVSPAVAGDFSLSSNKTLTIAAGGTSSSGAVTITANDNTTDAADKSVRVSASVSGASGAANPSNVTLTITDDDAAPTLSISSPSVTEGDSGSTTLTFKATLSAASGKTVKVNYADAGTGTATSGTDYTAFTSGTLTFSAGDTSKDIDVTVTGDSLDEPDETVVVTLSSATNASISAATGTGTITDDDSPPTVSMSAAAASVGESAGTKNLTVSLSAASGKAVTVPYTVSSESGDTATAGTDYTSVSTGSLTIAAGNSSGTITVTVTSDTVDEDDETFTVTLGTPTNAALGTTTRTAVTITDDDAAPTLSISSPSVTEGDSGSVTLTFKATLSAASGKTVKVNYADALTGTATSGTDYEAITAGTLTFSAGDTSKDIAVTVKGDALDEPDETVAVKMSSPVNATISAPTGTGTITDDDDAPTVSMSAATASVGESAGTKNLTVSLSAASGKAVTVPYTVSTAAGDTATAGTDYTSVSTGSLQIAAGNSSGTITVTVTSDTVDEADETFTVTLGTPTNAALHATATRTVVTITDDDAAPTVTLSLASSTISENGGTTTVTAALSHASSRDTTITLQAVSGFYTPGADKTIAISAGQTTNSSDTATINAVDDTIDNVTARTGTVTARADNSQGAGAVTGASLTLTDDEATPTVTLSLSDSSISENGGSATVTASLSGESSEKVTLTVSAAAVSPAVAGDFSLSSNKTLTIAAGGTSSSGAVTITANDNTTDAADKSVRVSASVSGTSGAANPSNVTLTITDDDAAPTLSISSPSVTEGDSGSVTLTFKATLSAASGKTVKVNYADAGTGTATSGTDYEAITAGTLTFSAGDTSKDIDVTVTGDSLNETDETVIVTLSSATNASISIATGTGTINDNDSEPTVSISSSASVGESDGTKDLTVSLSAASGKQVTVPYTVSSESGDTATAGTDYTSVSTGSLQIAAGNSSGTITVTVASDTMDEDDETFTMTLGTPTNAALGTTTRTVVTITDDDSPPSLSISSPSVTEGDSGSVTLTFKATLSAASGKTVKVNYADASTGTATSGTDYEAITAGTLTFSAGDTSEDVAVTVKGDTLDEPDETVAVKLSSPVNATISAPTGTGTITDNDDAPTVSMSAATASVGESAGTKDLTVSLSAASGRAVTVPYTVSSESGDTATVGGDYTSVSGGSLSIAAGNSSGTITVTVASDTVDEPDETFTVTLGTPTNAALHATATRTVVTITDDDAAPSLSISSPSVTEGDSGSVTLTFKATLSAASGKTVKVNYADAGTGTATSGTDYEAITAGTLTFSAGDTSEDIAVTVKGDALDEPDETVAVKLSSPVNATISAPTGTGTITDDDDAPTVSMSAATASVGESDGTKDLAVSLSAASGKQVTVPYTVSSESGDTATAGTDYTSVSTGSLTIAAGNTSGTITVTVASDTMDEDDETFTVTLGTPTNAALGTTTKTVVTITDDDAAPTLSISSPSVTEGDSGSVTLTFKATLSAASGKTVKVNYADASTGTATSGTDYEAITAGTLTFSAGDTSEDIAVTVKGDALDEPDETVAVKLSSPVSATISAPTGTGTITDDDDAPTVSMSAATASVGESAGTKNLTVSLSAVSGKAVTVPYTVSTAAGDTATAGTDYTSVSTGSLQISAGNSSGTITVTVASDTVDEADETFTVTLGTPTNAALHATATRTVVTITDDDAAPTVTLSLASSTISENGGSTTVTAALSHASSQDTTITLQAVSGFYTPGSDKTIAISAGQTTNSSDTATINAVDDTIDNVTARTGTVTARADNSQGAGAVTGASLTLTDDEATPTVTLSLSDSSISENGGSATVTASLSGESSEKVTLAVSAAAVSPAVAGDFSLSSNKTLTIAAGGTSSSGAVTITANDNTTDAADKSVRVSASVSGTSGVANPSNVTLTITDDDAAPSLSISSPSVTEGDSGSVTLTFKATLSAASGKTVKVNYADAGTGTATSGTDYTAFTSGTLTFSAGDTSKDIDVTVTGDSLNETDETVIVTLSSATNASISSASGTGTINDNDSEPTVSISSSASVGESDGTKDLTVSLSAVSGRAVTVPYTVSSESGDTATAGTDYTSVSTGSLAIAAGSASGTITVTVTSDTVDEADETFTVTLGTPTNAALGTTTRTAVTITDDDAAPSLSISSPSVTEGDSGSVTLTFEATLSAASGKTVKVNYADAGTGTATSGTDYEAVTAGTLTFSAGDTSEDVAVTVKGDALDEPDETVAVKLSSPVNATISAPTGTGTITDDDDAPTVSMSAATASVGESVGTKNLTVSLSAVSGKAVTVPYTVSTAAGDTATAGTDYTAVSSGSLSIAAGNSSGTITVTVTSDTVDEPDETFTVTLGTPTNAALHATATRTVVTITDDDAAPTVTLSLTSSTISENGGSTTVTAALSHASSRDTTITLQAVSGFYTPGADKTIAISAGQTTNSSDTATINAVDDTIDNVTARTTTVTARADNSQGAGAVTGASLTLTDDEATPTVTLSLSDSSISENGGSATVTASLSGESSEKVTLTVSAAAVSPAVAGDFSLSSNKTLTIAAGGTSSSGAVTITANDNTTDAADKSVRVSASVSGASGAANPSNVTLTITDDDAEPSLSISSPSVTEGDSGSVTLTFKATLSAASGKTVKVSYADALTGTATSGTDYEAITAGTLTFSAGDTSEDIAVTVKGDALDEPNETIAVKLSSPVNATISATTGTGTITNDDNTPTASAGADQTVTEGANVTLDGSASSDTDGDTLTYAWSQTSGTTVSLSSSTAQSPTFTAPTELLSNASLVFSLTVSDGVNTSTADTVTITVTAGANDAPTADAGTNQTVAEGASVTLDGSGSTDPENAALTYAWSQTSGTTVSLSSSTAQSPTFTAPTELLANASLVFSLKVSDGVNTSTADTVTITVTAGANDAPTADAGSDATVAEGATVTLDGSGSDDPENAALTYAWSQTSGTTVSLSSSTAQSPTFTAPTELLSNASLVFSLTVSDGVNTSTADTVTITVTAGANDAPTADAGSDATVTEGATVTLDGSGSTDPERAALTYAWSQTSGTTVSLSSSTAQSPTFTAPTELLANASLVFSLKVSDGVNTSTADTVTITVTAGANDAPTADAGSDATVAEGATVTLDGSGSDDPENAALTYAWSQTSGTTVSLSSSTAQSPTFTAPTELLSNASLVFSLKVSDGVNTSTADTVTITVTAGVNDAPTADAGSDATVAEGATVTLDGSGSTDPERAALTYAWSQTSGTTVSLSSSTAQSPTFTAPTELLSNASLVFSLKVSDGVNTSTADTVTITVTAGANDAPTADAGTNQTVAEGATVTLDGSGSTDPENAALTYAWSQTSGTTVSLSSSTAQSPTFTAPTELLSNASLVFSLKVSDGVNTSTADAVTITVTAGVNDAPTADAGSDATVAEGANVTLDGSGSTDPENAALTYAWNQTSGTTVSLSSSTAQSPTFTAPTELLSNASLVFSLKVSDGVNTSTADTVTITVTAGVNDAPTADAGSDATVAEGATVTLDGSGSTDPERAALTYAWSQTSGTTVSLSSSTAQSPTFTAPTELLSNASLVFSLTVSDGVNTSTADTVTITVTAGVNDAPTADAGSDATVAEGAGVTLDGSGSDDPENAALTYAWSQTSGSTVSLSSSTAQSPTFTAPTELLSNASLVFSLTVSDGVNTSTADTVTITVTAGANDAPTADAGSDRTVAEGANVTLDGSGSDDPENAALTYSWSQTSGTTVSLSSSTAQSPTFTAPTELLSNASLVFSLTVSDGVNTSTADTVTITVTAGVNDAPTADAGSDATVTEGATVTLDGSGSTDPERAALTYAWSQTSGTTVSLSSSTAQSPTFTAPTELLSNASLVFSLEVSDGVNTSTADTVTITVTAGANDAPTADAGTNQTVAEGANVTLDGSGSTDPERAALTYAWSQTSGTTVSLSSSTAQSPTFTAPTQLLTNAALVFSLTVSDGVNTSTADTVTITVTAGVNDAPTADAGTNQTVAEGATVTLDGSGSTDPERAALTYAWSQTSGTTVSLSSSTAQSPTFTAPTELLSNASLVFSLTVSDGVNTSTADTVTITVTAGANDAPTADAGSDQTVAEAATVTLDGSGSDDPENAALTYAWSQTSGSTVSLSSSTAQSPTFTAPTELLTNASLVFSLTVSDGVNTSTADTVTITVTAGANDAPTADAGSDRTVAEGASVTLDGSGSDDPENAALTYTWSQTSGTTVSLSSSTAQSPTFTAPTELLSNASLVFSLKVSDGVNTSTADTVTITVTAGANDAPTADAGSDRTVAEGAGVTLDGSGSDDPENAALTYAWSQTSGTTVSLSSSTAQSPTFTAPTELLSNASLVFSLKVSDGVNTSTADTVTITVTAGANDAPTADAGTNQTVAEAATVTLDGSGSDDPENAALTYSWSQTSGTTVSLSSSTAQSPTFTAPTELLSNASLVFSLKVSDGVNTSTADAVTITVTAGVNDAPTADAGTNQTVAEGATVTLDGSGSTDPERAALTYAWSQTSGTTVSLSSSTAQSPTFTAPTELLSNASLVFSLKVSDGVNTSTADTVTITVTAGVNDAPTADAGTNQTVAEGATVTLDGSGSTDPERAALTYAWSQTSGSTVSLSSSTAQSPTFTAPTELLSNASLVFSLKVSDGVNTSTADTVTITVTAGVNDAPTADAGTNQTVAEGATVTLDGSGSTDPERAALTYAWSQTSGTTVSLSSSTAQSPTFTAPTELLSNASLVFSLTVSDGVNTSTADTVTITVTAGANDAPTADAGTNQTVAEGASVTLDGSGSDDPENAALTYAWSQTSGSTVSLSSSTAQSPTFTAPTELLSNASLVFSLKVSDGVNTSTADTVTITVTAGANDAPTADAGSDRTVAEGANVTLDGSGSDDPENAALTYAWSQTSGTTVSLSSSTAQSPTFTAPTELLSNASLVFSLKVSDGVNTSTADTVTITVTAGANDAPTADAGTNQTVAEGANVTLDGSGSDDPENAALTYAWSQTSGTTVSLSSSTAQSPTFTAPTELLSNASLVFSLKVSDGVNTSTADTVTITVTAGANDAPTADAGTNQTVAEGANVTLDGSGSDDPENAALTYTWSQTSGTTVSLSSSTAQSPTFTAPTELLSNASLVFSLKVSDGVNTSTADTVTITVTAGANDAPTADAGSDATVAEGANVTLDGSGSDDPENAALTYAWSQTSGTTVSLSSSTAQSPTFTAPTELLANASLVFSLTVSDGVNTSTADTVTITVTAGANDAPTADAGSDATVAEGANVTLDGSGSDDPENAALTYSWSQTSGTTVSLSSSTAQSPTFTAPTELLSNASLVFSLTVSDGVNTSTADTVTITVTAGANDAPTADAGTNQTVAEGANVTLDGSGSDDPENAALTYAWSQTSGTTVSLSSSTAQSPTFTAPTELLSNASLVFSLKVSDGVNTSTADTVTITVTAGANDAPTADAGTNQTVAEGANVTLDGSGSDDPENAALTYAWSQTSGSTVSLSSSTAQSPTFTAPTELLSNASLVFSLKVSDGVNTSTADTVTITVTAGANDAPTADAGTNQTVAEAATVTLDGSGSDDPENAALTYSWSQTSGTTVSLSSSTAQSPTFTAPTELLANASLVFSLTVSDGVNTSTADTVTITVTAGANDAPTADAGSDATVAEGATVTLDGSGSDDPENAALTYSWSQTSGTTVSLSSSTAQSPTFTAPTELLANASLVFSLTVSDGVNTSTADTVTITVTAGANDAPTADAGSDATVAEGASVTLDGSGSDDPENAALTYSWSQTSGTTVSLSSSTAQSPTFTAPTELLTNASLVFSLTVSDGVNTSTADTVTITVTAGANDAPTADAGSDATVAEGASVTLDGSGSDDPENAALTYAWSQTSGTTVSLSSSTAQSPTFTAPTELLTNASLVFSLTVSDGVNTSTADTVTITVTAGANPPAPDTAPLDQTPEFSPDTFADQVFGKNQPVDVTLPQATGGDGELSYGLEPELPEGLGFDATTLAISGVPTEAMAPTPYTLTATDADGDSATLTFSVAVEEPVLISVSDAEPVAEGASGETTLAEFEVSLSRSSSLEVTVGYATRDSTAEAATDYSAASGVLTFSPGETGKTVSVTVNGDDEVEADETFALSLSSPSNGQVDPQNAEAEALILNDDEAVVSAEACGEAFPTGDTTVRISCSSGLPEIDLIVVLPARLTRNGVAIEEVTVTLTPSDQEIDGEMFGYTGDSDHHSLIDIDISPIPDDEVTIGLPVTPHLRGHARGRRLFLIRHSGAWEELESSSEDHRIHADVNGFSPFAVAYEIDTVRRRLGNVNRTILPELSRAVTSSALDAVTRRVEDAISGGAENVFTMPAPYTSEFNEPGPKLGELEDGHSVSLSEAVDGSYFSASLAGDRDRPGGGADPAPRGSDGLGVWVSGDYRSLSGAGSSVYWSGDLFAGHLGADYRFGSRLVAGIAASWFEGSFDYTETGAESSVSGDYDARMNGFYPYLGISLSPKVDVWAAGGWGFGEIKIDDGELSGRRKGGVGLATAAAGANVRLFADGATAVSLRAETWFSRLRMKDNGGRIEGITVKTDRLRAVLQGSHSLFFGSGALLEPSVELGLRRDGGDGETGTGAELGAGIGYMSPALGLAVDIRGRTLLAHEGSTKEWGVGGSVRFDPGEYGRGIFLNAVPSYGESSSAVDRLWDSETAVADAAGYGVSYGRTLSFETEVGYGFPAFGGRGFFTPYGAFGRHGSDGSSYRAGSRFSLGSSFDIGLEGQRQEFQGVEPEHGITLTGSVNW